MIKVFYMRFVCTVCLLCIGYIGFSQETNFNLIEQKPSTSNIYLQQMTLGNVQSNPEFRNRTAKNVTVINQIGNGNYISTNIISNTSSINYLQLGNGNNIESYASINDVNELIVQQGDNNSVLNYSFGSVQTTSLSLFQNGNNQSFEKFGTNTQTNNLAFRLTGDNRSIIVRSY